MSKLKKNNSHPLYKYHPVRYAASRESYITEAMNILFRDCRDGAYISQCPDTKCLRVTCTSVKNKQGKYNNNCIDDYEEIISLTLEAVDTETSIYENIELIKEILLNDEFYQKSELDIEITINQIINYLKLAINCALYLQSVSGSSVLSVLNLLKN